jgi:membrane protein YdbS with pleckstrin-like domain
MMDAAATSSLPLEPANKLDRRAISVWRRGNLLVAFIVLPFIIAIAVIAIKLADLAPDWLVITIAAAMIGFMLLLAWFQPEFAWRHWRYEIRDDEIDLKRGWLSTTRTLVPITRVQHIDTRQGLIERQLSTATLLIHTAAGTISIPALPEQLAASIGTRITALANIHDDL